MYLIWMLCTWITPLTVLQGKNEKETTGTKKQPWKKTTMERTDMKNVHQLLDIVG